MHRTFFNSIYPDVALTQRITKFVRHTYSVYMVDPSSSSTCKRSTYSSYLNILIHVPCIFYCFVLWPTNAELFHKLSHYCVFRHTRVILRDLVINTLPSHTSISNAAVDFRSKIQQQQKNTRHIYWKRMQQFGLIKHVKQSNWRQNISRNITNSYIWNTCVTWLGSDYKFPEDDTIVSKHVGE
jgi:hypothetical protein